MTDQSTAREDTPEDRSKARRVAETRRIFAERRKLLAALFPENGETLVARACAVACSHVNSPTLGGCQIDTLIESVIGAHHLGLEIGDQAYLVPYKGKVQLIVGPRGLIALMFRSGFVKSVFATSVFQADVDAGLFKYNLARQEIAHQKAPTGRRVRDKTPQDLITHAYCLVETTTGGRGLEVLTAEDIAFYRSFSKASSGPWFNNYEGMCRKTAIKRGSEFVPRSPLMAAALRETPEGGYEIPEDMWERAKLLAAGIVQEQVPADVAASRDHGDYTGHGAREPEKVLLGSNGERQPGEDG